MSSRPLAILGTHPDPRHRLRHRDPSRRVSALATVFIEAAMAPTQAVAASPSVVKPVHRPAPT